VAAGAELVCVECVSGGEAMGLFRSLGFEAAHESVLWAPP
jgi:hypothetical protein